MITQISRKRKQLISKAASLLAFIVHVISFQFIGKNTTKNKKIYLKIRKTGTRNVIKTYLNIN